MTNKEQDTTPNVTARDANKRSVQREKHPIEALPDENGEPRDLNLEKYPDDSAAHDGQATPPSGQGGVTPKARPDYQDMFPKNPEPSETAREWGEKVRKVGSVQAASDAIAEAARSSSGDDKGPNKGTGTATSSGPKNS